MNPPRILHVNSVLTGGGTDEACVGLVQELARMGQDVSVAGPASQFDDQFRRSGVKLLPTPRHKSMRVTFAVAEHIRELKPQIVHAHHGRDYWPTILAARLSRQRPKIVLTRHLASSPSSVLSKYFLLGQCDALIAVSEFVDKVLREGVYESKSPETDRRSRAPLRGDLSKIAAIAGGVDTARFRPMEAAAARAQLGLKLDDFAFGVIGAYGLPRGKGQREFLRAAATIHQRMPRARFVIIGRGSMETILKADIEQLGLAGKAWLTGFRSDMPEVMNTIDCLVHPQVGTEAFGLVICEAHACGKPVIASALDGIPEAFNAAKVGQLVTPESIPELAEAMLRCAQQPTPNAEQRQRMHAHVDAAFSLPVLARRTMDLYERVLAK